jgi:glycosyltransferase involved in cell wall biosynthesis
MRIAQIAPLAESVPPKMYGGTERIVSSLTEGLVARGHDVTLFASGDSETKAKLVACASEGLRLQPGLKDPHAMTTVELARVFEQSASFDVIHNHVDYFGFPFARFSRTPVVTTTHGRLDLEEVRFVYRNFPEAPLVSISNDQRTPLPDSNWIDTIYNGIEFDHYSLHAEAGKYLAFLGRISPEKRPDRAIEVARELDMPLKIAAKVDPQDQDYFDHAIKPQLDNSLVEFVGEVREHEKDEFLGNALAYLFPIDWPEPFGLTMVEAMACGTPVVAMREGSVPEVVVDGETGYVCDSLREFIDCVTKVSKIDRATCRRIAQERFSVDTMIFGYERVYEKLAA